MAHAIGRAMPTPCNPSGNDALLLHYLQLRCSVCIGLAFEETAHVPWFNPFYSKMVSGAGGHRGGRGLRGLGTLPESSTGLLRFFADAVVLFFFLY